MSEYALLVTDEITSLQVTEDQFTVQVFEETVSVSVTEAVTSLFVSSDQFTVQVMDAPPVALTVNAPASVVIIADTGGPGIQGPQGLVGPVGPIGLTGPQGAQGIPGPNSGEFRTITSAESLAGSLTLAGAPATPSKVRVWISGGTLQKYGFDFIVSVNQLIWIGYALETTLSTGDDLLIEY